MAISLATRIGTDRIEPGCLAIYWLSQAGFVFKGPSGKIVYIDPYFSDVVEHRFGFKRMMPCPVSAEEVDADLLLCTHEHLDHLDPDGLPIVARNPRVRFAGPIECFKAFRDFGIREDRCILLEEGQDILSDGIRISPVFADHGDLAPDALGVVLEMDGVKIYHTGDTAYRPVEFAPAIRMKPDVLLPCINGRYGNLDAHEAALLTQMVHPRLSIASHFWMFVEHGGDPAQYLEDCSRLAPGVEALVMRPGERLLFRQQ